MRETPGWTRVLLDNPVKGKLDPRWTGPWTVVGLKKPSTVFLRVGTAVRGVHLNRIRPLLEGDIMDPVVPEDWTPPLFQEGGCPAPPGGENLAENLCRVSCPQDVGVTCCISAAVSTPV